MPAPKEVIELIDTFGNNIDFYKSEKYNEAQIRQEFIDPLFKQLGWDMDNALGLAPQYRDVIHEASIKIGSSTKAPDYAFSIHGQYKFFLEAKKPSVNVKNDMEPAYQLRRYGWSAKLPISIVTDFEEFAIYDCRIRPKRGEKASNSRISYFKYTDYVEKWDELRAIFSKEAILKGSFDKYTVNVKKHRGADTVDDAFLDEIENWRTLLAKNIAKKNKDITIRDLNYSVQKIIDRLIFLRICEDRGIEDYKNIGNLLESKDIYNNLLKLFKDADSRYNSGLFHFTREADRGMPDCITTELIIDDSIFKEIISKIYYPDSPYEFSVLPADILGQVYEQFLGKTIVLSKSHKASVEDKPEIRKAGGVFYTPTYVVKYIVKHSLGCLLNGKSGNAPISIIEASKIALIDPACGSGSFLIDAYQYLLDWHLIQYTTVNNSLDKSKIKRHSSGKTPKLYMTPGGYWELTTDERKRILVNNIFGVDVDAQAVEVTKLSLLLKVIEGETSQIKQTDWIKQRQRILPDLGDNIKCGNTLISPDFYLKNQIELIEEDEQYRINVFNWDKSFSKKMKDGGFNCIVGNPPWGAAFAENELEYLRGKHKDIIVRMVDSYMYFVKRSFEILAEGGTLGMIVPDVLLYQKDSAKLRKYMLDRYKLMYVINTGDVFEKVTRPASIFIAQNIARKSKNILVADLSSEKKRSKELLFERGLEYSKASVSLVKGLPNTIIPTRDIDNYSIVNKLLGASHKKLAQFIDSDGIQRGVSPDFKDAFVLDAVDATRKDLETQFLKPVVTGGKTIKRYYKEPEDLKLIYTTRHTDVSKCPNIIKHITGYTNKITCKEVKAGKHPIYSLHRPRKESIFLKDEKLIGVITEDEIVLYLDTGSLYATDGLYLFSAQDPVVNRYLMAVMNSSLFLFLYRNLAVEKGRVLAQVKPTLLSSFPIYDIFEKKGKNGDFLDEIVKLVDKTIDTYERFNTERNPGTAERLKAQIDITLERIDEIVFELYQLNAEEISKVKIQNAND